jgi:dolichyl-phosphate-mannose--protein O-mannosyl transferase
MGKLSTLVVIGNPILWWSGIISFTWAMLQGWRRKEVFYVLVALLSLYLPWILAPRDLTFIYHFFPMTPFWFLLLTMYFKHITERSEKLGKTVTTTIVVAAFLVFVIFYPAISAIEIDRSFAEAMWKWMPTWQFF